MSATATQPRIITPERWIVRRSSIDGYPERGEIVSRQTTESAARRYVRRHMRIQQLRSALSWPTTTGIAYHHHAASGPFIFHIEHLSPEEYVRLAESDPAIKTSQNDKAASL